MDMNGNLRQKKSYALSLDKNIAIALELVLLMLSGAFAAFLHAKLRIPLNMPGHHGLEFMAIFTLVRMNSNLRYAATIATLGTGLFLMMPGMGASNPLNSFGYLLPGIFLDIFYTYGKKRMHLLFIVAITAGFAYMCIPLSRLLVTMISGFPYNAFVKFGAFYTTLSFLFFGMLGGMLGYGMNKVKTIMNNKQKK